MIDENCLMGKTLNEAKKIIDQWRTQKEYSLEMHYDILPDGDIEFLYPEIEFDLPNDVIAQFRKDNPDLNPLNETELLAERKKNNERNNEVILAYATFDKTRVIIILNPDMIIRKVTIC